MAKLLSDNTAQQLLRVIGRRTTSGVGGRVRRNSVGGDSSIQHAYPPSGGIPAATWDAATEQMTPGKASCRIAEQVDGIYEPTEDTVMVENPVGLSVGISGKPMTIGKNTSGEWTVLVEDCSGTTGGPVADPDQDPVDGNIDIGIRV